LANKKWALNDNTFAIQRIKMGDTRVKQEIPLFIRFMESVRKLDENYFFNDNERKIRVSSILNLYIEIVNKYQELAEQYKVPIKDKFLKVKEE